MIYTRLVAAPLSMRIMQSYHDPCASDCRVAIYAPHPATLRPTRTTPLSCDCAIALLVMRVTPPRYDLRVLRRRGLHVASPRSVSCRGNLHVLRRCGLSALCSCCAPSWSMRVALLSTRVAPHSMCLAPRSSRGAPPLTRRPTLLRSTRVASCCRRLQVSRRVAV